MTGATKAFGRQFGWAACGAVVLMLPASPRCSAAQSVAPVKLSTSGICHEPGSRFYEKTLNYRPYATLDECLRAGGRLPRGVKPMSPPSSKENTASTSPAPPSTQPHSVTPASPDIARPVPSVPPADEIATEHEVHSREAKVPWAAIGAGGLVLSGLAWWGLRTRLRRREEELKSDAGDRRSWQGHRLSKYDRADEAKLLLAVGGDRDAFERLVQYELSRAPQSSREQAVSDAYARWKRDNS